MFVSTAVVAHTARRTQAFDLAIQLDASVAYDLGEHGPGVNHRRAWQLANTPTADWVLVVEDDAIPCSDFHTRLHTALEAAPTPVVSLYLGTSYPLHRAATTAQAVAEADNTGSPWIMQDTLNHAVAVAIRQDLVDDMLTHTDIGLPIDDAISAWAQASGYRTSYTHPSLVDHRDDHTIIQHPDGIERTMPRKAWRYAG